jgi:hypothetical protein
VAFTSDIYSNIMKGRQSDAITLLDEILPQGMNGIGKIE